MAIKQRSTLFRATLASAAALIFAYGEGREVQKDTAEAAALANAGTKVTMVEKAPDVAPGRPSFFDTDFSRGIFKVVAETIAKKREEEERAEDLSQTASVKEAQVNRHGTFPTPDQRKT